MADHFDIGIVGGGMVGASLALALRESHARIVLIESQPRRPAGDTSDQRGLALSAATQRILEHAGVWPRLAPHASPIRRVHVSEEGRFGCVRLDAGLIGMDSVGAVVNGGILGAALMDAARELPGMEVLQPAIVTGVTTGENVVEAQLDNGVSIQCRLLIAADGTASPVRRLLGIEVKERDYGQAALVSVATPRAPHEDTAYERFSASGPLAVLPMRDGRCSVVCCVPSSELTEHQALDDAAFLQRINKRFGGRLDGFTAIGKRSAYPLSFMEPLRQTANRVVLLGNSAHTIHPNGAQGLNLGVRDAAGLAEHVREALLRGDDPGATALLANYVESRAADQRRVVRFTDELASMFYNRNPGRMLARSALMGMIEHVPMLKRALLRGGAGLHGRQPAWVRGAA